MEIIHFVCPLSIKQWEVKLHKKKIFNSDIGEKKPLQCKCKMPAEVRESLSFQNGLSKCLSGMIQAKVILLSGRKVDYGIPQGFFLPYFPLCLRYISLLGGSTLQQLPHLLEDILHF